MEYSRRRDFMFCNICGTMLTMTSHKYAQCPLCKSKRKAKDICKSEICYTVSAEDIRRELRIEQFVKPDGKYFEHEVASGGQTTQKKCEKCDSEECTYTEMQTRSADEGATIFYTCKQCGHKFKE